MWLLSLSLALPLCSGHMSMQYPLPRDRLNGVLYAKWQANEPMVTVHPEVCHGLDHDISIRADNQFSAGDEITIDIYGSIPHDGGHCTFWYSTDDETFTKIIDVKDCTLNGASVVLPYSMPAECQSRCTFAFSWVPRVSGACEIYMNCADISVAGAVGGNDNAITKNFQTEIIDRGEEGAFGCERVDPDSHWTAIFMPLKTTYDDSELEPSDDSTPSDTEPAAANTPSPSAPAPVTPSPTTAVPVGDGILITNRPDSTAWWYSVDLSDIPSGIEIESVWLRQFYSAEWQQGAYHKWGGYWTFNQNPPMDGPFDFKLVSKSGLEIVSEDVVEDYSPGKSGRMTQSFDGAFTAEEETESNDLLRRVTPFLVIFVALWVIVCLVGALWLRKRRQQQKAIDAEMMRTTQAADEAQRIELAESDEEVQNTTTPTTSGPAAV